MTEAAAKAWRVRRGGQSPPRENTRVGSVQGVRPGLPPGQVSRRSGAVPRGRNVQNWHPMKFQAWVPFLRLSLVPVLALGLVVGGVAFDEQQRIWVFQPSKKSWVGASAVTGMQDQWISFESREAGTRVKLHGLWLPQPSPTAPVLLYLHGARWDVRAGATRMRRMHELGFSVLGIDYRGFGRSTDAVPSEATAHEDARAAWDWLAARQPKAPRYLYGDASGLMVEGTFTSVPEVFSTFKWGWLPVGPLITQRFDSASRIGRVKSPVLVIHGSDDRYIPPARGMALYERATAPKRFLLIKGGTHRNANAIDQAQFRQALSDLFGLSLLR